MGFLLKDNPLIILLGIVIVIIGILFLVTTFKIQNESKALRIILFLLGVLFLATGIFGILFLLFFGVNY